MPQVYDIAGVNVLASGDPTKVPANTVMDVNRYQQDLAALAPSHQLSLLSLAGIDRRFGNGYVQAPRFSPAMHTLSRGIVIQLHRFCGRK